ncbi:MAG: hypothetical protein NTW73_00285 [Candidatus Parcubacteria bacterium]|nr:hypothetical protein [Candidatus Parcubacteria bacterium]
MLLDEDIVKFQVLYKSELGIEISREDAYEKGIKLLRLMSIVYKPMTEQEHELIQKHRKDTLPLLKQNITEKLESSRM